jgi:hypothetical protein
LLPIGEGSGFEQVAAGVDRTQCCYLDRDRAAGARGSGLEVERHCSQALIEILPGPNLIIGCANPAIRRFPEPE